MRNSWGSRALVWLLLLSFSHADDSLVSIGDKKYLKEMNTDGKITLIRYPVLGCPSIVKAGNAMTAWLKLPNGGVTADFEVEIVTAGDDLAGATYKQTFALPVQGIQYDADRGLYKVIVQVPSNVPEEMFNFKVTVPSLGVTDIQYNSLKVMAQESNDYTFIVIADPQTNDPRGILKPANHNPYKLNAMSVMQQMKAEIRALRPAFAIVCGDLLFGLDYEFEYNFGWEMWRSAGFPVFMVPGNHDGYAHTKDRTILGVSSPQGDGLDLWRKYFGPTYFSFSWGGMHLQGVNSYDGTPDRRDSFLIVVQNFGGDLSPGQMNWIAWDLAGTKKSVVPFMHHNPSGPYKDNKTFSVFVLMPYILHYLSNGKIADMDQTWNSKDTGEFLIKQYQGKAPLVFIGHEHYDNIKVSNGIKYRLVTTASSAGAGYWGYAVVTVKGSKIHEHVYLNDKFRSHPTGNLYVDYMSANNGLGIQEKAKVRSGLGKSVDVTIPFFLKTSDTYGVENGQVVQKSDLGNGMTKVWVRATAPAAPSINSQKSVVVTVKQASPPPAAAPVMAPASN